MTVKASINLDLFQPLFHYDFGRESQLIQIRHPWTIKK